LQLRIFQTTTKRRKKMKTPLQQEIVDTLTSMSGMNIREPLLAVIGSFSIGAVSGFIGDWIFDPAVSYFALIGLIVADHITGVTLAMKRNDFQTRKAARIFWTVIAHTALLLFATSLSKGSPSLFWLNEAIFVPLVLINLVSLVKNLSLLGYIKKSFAAFLYKKIDTYKNDILKTDEKPDSSSSSDNIPN